MSILAEIELDLVRNIIKSNMVEHAGKVITGDLINSISQMIVESLRNHFLNSIGNNNQLDK